MERWHTSERTVGRLFQKFLGGNETLKDEEGWGWTNFSELRFESNC